MKEERVSNLKLTHSRLIEIISEGQREIGLKRNEPFRDPWGDYQKVKP